MSESTPAPALVDPGHDKDYTIIVNAQEKVVESDDVSYAKVVQIAYPTPPTPDTTFTVTYRNAQHPHEGSLIAGQSVEVKKTGTIFNVKATGRS